MESAMIVSVLMLCLEGLVSIPSVARTVSLQSTRAEPSLPMQLTSRIMPGVLNQTIRHWHTGLLHTPPPVTGKEWSDTTPERGPIFRGSI